jgi:tetratricopeptide (TPR) repeat protein
MNTIAKGILVVVLLGGPAAYGAVLPCLQQSKNEMDRMGVSDLEKSGDTCRFEKLYDLGVQYYQAALRRDRKNADLYNKLGLAHLRLNDTGAARSSFIKAAKYNPKNANALNNVGAVDYLQKKYDSAGRYFKRAVALDETSAVFHVNLGAAWFAQNKLDRAVIEYSRAVELDPNVLIENAKVGVTAQISTPEERAKYEYMLARIYAKRGDIDHCLACLKRAKEQGYRNLASVYKDDAFSRLRRDQRLAEVVGTPQ